MGKRAKANDKKRQRAGAFRCADARTICRQRERHHAHAIDCEGVEPQLASEPHVAEVRWGLLYLVKVHGQSD